MAHYLLDVNETLSDLSPIRAILHHHGAPAELGHTWFASVLRDGFALSMQGRAPAFLDLARQCLSTSLSRTQDLDTPLFDVVDDVLETLSRLEVHPDVVPGILALTDAGHVVSAFSNGSASSTQDLLGRAGVLDRLTNVLSVEGTGV